MTINQVSNSGGSTGGTERPKSVAQAAEAFESLFLGQLLKMAREAGSGDQLGEPDPASSSVMEMAEERLASEITKGGGLGLARVVTQQIRRQDEQNTAAAANNKTQPTHF